VIAKLFKSSFCVYLFGLETLATKARVFFFEKSRVKKAIKKAEFD